MKFVLMGEPVLEPQKERPTVEDPKFIRLYKCCYYKLININTPTSNINYHKINFS